MNKKFKKIVKNSKKFKKISEKSEKNCKKNCFYFSINTFSLSSTLHNNFIFSQLLSITFLSLSQSLNPFFFNKMTTGAGTNWSLIEDVALCTSWVEVTHSSLTGNEMQLREMWSLIHTNFLEKIGGKRTKESMSSRWKLLSQSFSTWRDALAQASSNIRSGENYSDQVTIYYLFDTQIYIIIICLYYLFVTYIIYYLLFVLFICYLLTL